MRTAILLTGTLALAACNGGGTTNDATNAALLAQDNVVANEDFETLPPNEAPTEEAGNAAALPLVEPIEPGKPGGLPDDRTPIADSGFSEDSAQGAANVVQTYFALIGEKKYGEAYDLWQPDSAGATRAAFVQGFDKYTQYDAQIGAPGRIDSGAGQRYVEVPVQLYGRLKSGEAFHKLGKVTLHRVDGGIDGATAAQKRWRIAKSDLKL